jgi:hypothetical protein
LELHGYEHLFYDDLPRGRFPAVRDIFIPVPTAGVQLEDMDEALRVEECDFHFARLPTMTPLFRTNVVPEYAHRPAAFIASRCAGVQSVQ